MVEIKAGPELDRAVADVLGLQSTYVRPYSTDLNAAFAAAERVGLFSETFWRTLGMDEFGETWGVFEQDGNCKRSIGRENHRTPALAICAAILDLAKVGDEPTRL